LHRKRGLLYNVRAVENKRKIPYGVIDSQDGRSKKKQA